MNTTASSTIEPGPTRIVLVDLEDPLPELAADVKYGAAMVVGRRSGVPCAAVQVDLRSGEEAIQEQLAPLFERAVPVSPAHPEVAEHDLPSISVVVPTMVARTQDLQLLLDGFAAVHYPNVEFILVDNRRSTPENDPLPALVAGGRPGLRVVRALRPGISAARNAGIAAATGEIIAFTDDDVRVDAQWLQAIGRRFAVDPSLDAVTGMILPAELETPAQIWFERFYGGFGGERTFIPLTLQAEGGRFAVLHGSRITARDLRGAQVRRFSVYGVGAYGAGANMAFRREALQRLGLFDVALGTGTPARGGEDLAMMISVLWTGGKIGYEPASVVHHRHRRGLDELYHQLQGNGLGFTAMLTSLIRHDPRHFLGLSSQLPLALRQMIPQTINRLTGHSADHHHTGHHGHEHRSPDHHSHERQASVHRPDHHATDHPATDHDPDDRLYPRELVLNELRGYPQGPRAYLRSSRVARAWSEEPEPAPQ